MWNAIVLSAGLVLGVALGKIEYFRSVKLDLSISLWKEWIFLLFLAVFVYFACVFYPLYRLVNLNGEFYVVQPKAVRKNVSARLELKRRASWPVAYSRNIHTRYQPEF